MQEKTLTNTNMSLADLQNLGQAFFVSKLFPDIESAAQAVVKIAAGRELDFPPVYSMTKIYIVKGKVMVSSEALGAMVKRSGRYDYQVAKLTDTECELMFTDKGNDTYLSRFSMEDAKRAGLMKEGGGWYTWPRAMLMSKALSQGARIVCPHVIAGAYTPEDMGIEANPDTGEIKVEVMPPLPPNLDEFSEVPKKDETGVSAAARQNEPAPGPLPSPDVPVARLGINMVELQELAKKCNKTVTDLVRWCASTFHIGMKSSRNFEGLVSQLPTQEQKDDLMKYLRSLAEVS